MVRRASKTAVCPSSAAWAAQRIETHNQAAAYTFVMRLSQRQRDVIRQATAEVAGPSARVLLFGSRTRDDLRGGDIDPLVELAQPDPNRWELGIKLGSHIERQLGLQKIDILVADPDTPNSPVLEAARLDGIPV